MDESYSIALARAIADHSYPLLDSGNIIWRDPLFHYLLAAITAITGTTEITTRILSVVVGVAACGLLYLIAKKLFSHRVGIIILLLSATSYWEIAWSRQARMYILLQFFFWLTVYLYLRWEEKQTLVRFIPIMGAATATIATHLFGIFVIPTLLCAFALQKTIQRAKTHPLQFIIGYVAAIAGIIVAAVATVRLLMDQQAVNYWMQYSYYFATHHWATLAFATLGLFVGLKTYSLRHTLWLWTLIITSMGIFSYGITLLQYRYLFFVWPVVMLFAAVGIHRIVARRRWYLAIPIVALLLCSGEYIVVPQSHVLLESDAPYGRSGYKSFTPQPDFRAAYEEIAKRNPDILITPYPTITRLYRDRNDAAAIYIDLTGLDGGGETEERYSGVPYLTKKQLKKIVEDKKHGIILIDYFARRRMDPELYLSIDTQFTTLQTIRAGSWSDITLYAF